MTVVKEDLCEFLSTLSFFLEDLFIVYFVYSHKVRVKGDDMRPLLVLVSAVLGKR